MFYSNLGFSYNEILCALAVNHHIIISLRNLKRILGRLNLLRRKGYTDVLEVAYFINKELRGHDYMYMHGYRWMHRKCLEYGLCVSRDTVYTLLQILDPWGIKLRKKGRLMKRQYFAKEPNYLWHVDS